ncbi:Cytochrome b6 [Platanthera guangdongensis]|uniref:Cytochrome b6 n=1 Tax=Platanthera guangdongensis TaxID=2320717 RepID=A0ABR2MTH7_9ASPA
MRFIVALLIASLFVDKADSELSFIPRPKACIHALHISLEFAPRNIAIPTLSPHGYFLPRYQIGYWAVKIVTGVPEAIPANDDATTLHGSIRTAPSIHRLRLGILGYLIPFAPLAFVSQCQCRPSRVLSPLVFFPISTHFTAPPEIPSAPTVLQLGSFHRLSGVEPWDLTADLKSHLQTLYAQSFRITLASSVLPRLLAQS